MYFIPFTGKTTAGGEQEICPHVCSFAFIASVPDGEVQCVAAHGWSSVYHLSPLTVKFEVITSI